MKKLSNYERLKAFIMGNYHENRADMLIGNMHRVEYIFKEQAIEKIKKFISKLDGEEENITKERQKVYCCDCIYFEEHSTATGNWECGYEENKIGNFYKPQGRRRRGPHTINGNNDCKWHKLRLPREVLE